MLLHRLIFKKIFQILFAIILFREICVAQDDGRHTDNKSFAKLQDDTIKREIALFSLRGASGLGASSLDKELQEVPLKKCSDRFAIFEKGNIYDSELIIDISASRTASESVITEIRMMFGKYGLYILPDSAILDTHAPQLCQQYTKRNRPIKSNCRAFCSADKRRIYIYMCNSVGTTPSEVTWIIQDKKYFKRVVSFL